MPSTRSHAARTARAAVALSLALAALLALPAGCVGTALPDNSPKSIVVELVNDSTYVIDANFFRSGDATSPAALFVRENIDTGYNTNPIPTLGAGQTAAFELACDAAAALGVRRPVFSNPLTLTGGEAAEELFLLSGKQFACGQKVRFTYSATAGFHVAVEVLAK